MKNDLISRSAVIDIIHKEIERTSSFAEHDTQINIEFAVKELPCAYDVDKVVEGIHNYFKKVLDDMECEYIPHEILDYNKAVCTIVRNGGKE